MFSSGAYYGCIPNPLEVLLAQRDTVSTRLATSMDHNNFSILGRVGSQSFTLPSARPNRWCVPITFALSSLSLTNTLSPHDMDSIRFAHCISHNEPIPTYVLAGGQSVVNLYVHLILDGMEHSQEMTFYLSNSTPTASTISGFSDIGASLIITIAKRRRYGAYSAGTSLRENLSLKRITSSEISYPTTCLISPSPDIGPAPPPSTDTPIIRNTTEIIAATLPYSTYSCKARVHPNKVRYDCYFDSSMPISTCPLACLALASDVIQLTDGSAITILPSGSWPPERLTGTTIYKLNVTLTREDNQPLLTFKTNSLTSYFLAVDTNCFTLVFPSQISLTALKRPANSDRIFRAPYYHILRDVFKQFSNIPPVPNDVLIWSARLLDCHASSYQDMIYSISTPFLSLKSRSICLSHDLTSEARNQTPLKPSCSFSIDGTEPPHLQAALPVFFESFKTPTADNGYSLGSLESNISALKTELDSLPTTQLVLALLLSHIDVLSSNTSQDLAEFTTWMNSKIMELKMEEVVPTLVSMCLGLQEAVNAAIPEVRHTSMKWKLLHANDIISLSAATAISASKLPTSYWTPLRLLMTSNEQYPHPCLPQVLDNISTISSYSSWTHPSMTGRQTVMMNLNVMAPLLDDTRPTSSIFEDLKPRTKNLNVPFTLDFNCSYNIVNRDWLLHLCRITDGVRVRT